MSQLQSYLNHIDREGKYSKRNRKLIDDFLARCQAMNLSEGRQLFYVRHFSCLAKWVKKDFEKLDKKDVERIVAEINKHKKEDGEPLADWTRKCYLISLKKILQFAHGLDWNSREYPDCAKWINGHVCKIKKQSVSAEQLLSSEEVFNIIGQANNARDKLWITLSFETGWRPDEIHGIRLKDVKLTENGALITISGYKRPKPETLLVVHSVSRLLSWLEIHPDKDNPEASLWIGFERNKRVCRDYYRKKLKLWANRAGVNRRVWPYLLRHSAITADRFKLSSAAKKVYYGWRPTSDMEGFYTHLRADNVNEAIAQSVGKLPKKEEQFKARTCPRCNAENPPGKDFCLRCNGILTERGLQIKEKELTENQNATIAELIDQRLRELLK